MVEKTQPPQLATAGIPHHAIRAWRDLDAALQDHPAVPCRTTDPDLWTSDYAEDRRIAAAACKGCPVLLQCQAYAFTAPEKAGVWGGLTPEQRQKPAKALKPPQTGPGGRGPVKGSNRVPAGR